MEEPQIVTFGCRLNTYESEVMRQHAKQAGLGNAIIVNTCAVTAEAERQARQTIRKMRREHPKALIIATGCAVQIRPKVFEAMPEVDRVLGNQDKLHGENFKPEIPQRVLVQDIMEIKETAHHLVTGFESKARAFIEIQNGCNHRCTFCTIPYGRGNNRSTPAGFITDQLHVLVQQGFQEVVLTGVDITDYGQDLPGKPTLGRLVQRIFQQVPELSRLRLSSLDPVEVDPLLLECIQQEQRLMPHFHLSLQAGANLILKRMKRRHLREDAIAWCEQVKALRPEAVFGADLIVGFPTETEEMFQETLALVEQCGLSYLHVFPYSPREGTPAAKMPQVPRAIIKARAARLRHAGQARQIATLDSFIGKTVSVLAEQQGFGYTEHFAPAKFQDISPLDKTIVKGRVEKVENGVLQVVGGAG
ncbi:MAG: tRNA (N(6)-L-threonylcarbamoyladenosine(37)-C(2))-methylthiotransferase MtaB [Alphaproteobacteria bacterium]